MVSGQCVLQNQGTHIMNTVHTTDTICGIESKGASEFKGVGNSRQAVARCRRTEDPQIDVDRGIPGRSRNQNRPLWDR